MLDKVLAVLATNTKMAIAAAAGAALVAGGSAVAISNVSDNSTAETAISENVADAGQAAALAAGDNRSETATAKIDLPEPPADEAKDNHGACVSTAVAAAKTVGTDGEADGAAVATAAKSCENPGAAKAAEAKARAEAARKAAEAKRAEAAKRSATQRDAAEQKQPSDAGSQRDDAGSQRPAAPQEQPEAGSRDTGDAAATEGKDRRPTRP